NQKALVIHLPPPNHYRFALSMIRCAHGFLILDLPLLFFELIYFLLPRSIFSSVCIKTAPINLNADCSCGNTRMTSVRLFTSALSRSNTFVVLMWVCVSLGSE